MSGASNAATAKDRHRDPVLRSTGVGFIATNGAGSGDIFVHASEVADPLLLHCRHDFSLCHIYFLSVPGST